MNQDKVNGKFYLVEVTIQIARESLRLMSKDNFENLIGNCTVSTWYWTHEEYQGIELIVSLSKKKSLRHRIKVTRKLEK